MSEEGQQPESEGAAEEYGLTPQEAAREDARALRAEAVRWLVELKRGRTGVLEAAQMRVAYGEFVAAFYRLWLHTKDATGADMTEFFNEAESWENNVEEDDEDDVKEEFKKKAKAAEDAFFGHDDKLKKAELMGATGR